jgi:hypothetical protein
MINAHEPHQPAGSNESWDELVQRCWSRQECWDCLRHEPCGWCPSVRRVALHKYLQVPNPMIVRDMRAQYFPVPSHCSSLQSRCMLTLVGALGATGSPAGLPCVHHYTPNLHHIRAIDVRGYRPSCCWCESHPMVHTPLES